MLLRPVTLNYYYNYKIFSPQTYATSYKKPSVKTEGLRLIALCISGTKKRID